MNADERVKAVANFGFTERQARFLLTVMLNGGVCVPRQYAQFVGTAYGQNVNAFFDKLVDQGLAVKCPCVHNRARVYQLRHQALYRAVGEPNSPNRKPIAAGRLEERLMLLDAIVSQQGLGWLSTVSDKVAFFTEASSCPPERLPHRSIGGGANSPIRLFPDALPIGLQDNGRPVFIFVVSTSNDDEVRAFVQRHADLLGSLPGWTIRLVLPAHFEGIKSLFEGMVRDELASPMSPRALEELHWYFGQRRRLTPGENDEGDRFRRVGRAFAGTRWRLLYRRWLADGDAVFNTATSPTLREAIARGDGIIESEVLPRSYRHLSPLASLVRARVRGVEEGDGAAGSPQPPSAERAASFAAMVRG